MKINIKDLIEIVRNGTSLEPCRTNIATCMLGKYVIVRTRNEGINCGIVEAADETGIILVDVRRIWYHQPYDKKMSWYEGVAISGLSDSSKISEIVQRKVIMEDYSITECTDAAIKSLKEYPGYEPNQ